MAILDSAGSNINIDGNVTSFTDFGGLDTYTILNSLSADVTIADNNISRINLPEGLDVAAASFLSDGVQFTVNGNTATLLGNPAAFSYVFGGTPLDANAGTALDYQATAAAFGTTVPASGAPANEAVAVGSVNSDGSVGTGGTTPNLPTISLAPTNGETTEGDSGTTSVTFTATLSEASSELVSVDYATASSTAQAGLDFLAASGSLVFSPGTTEQTFDVEIVGDTDYEPDEIFRAELSNPQGAALDQSGSVIKGFEALHTIQNDDLPADLPTVSLAPTNGQTTEGDSGNTVVTFTATLSNASSELVAVDYATSSSSAQSGLDFLAASGSLVFSPGTTQKTFDVEIVGDTEYEPDEIFRVALSNPQGAALDQSGTVIKGFEALHTILDDDQPTTSTDDHSNTLDSSATPLTLGVAESGEIERHGDKDVFRLDVVSGQQYTVQLTNSDDVGISNETIYASIRGDGSGSIFGDEGESNSYTFEADGNGTVYFRMENSSSSGPDGNTYSVVIYEFF